jgi:hypothetical protein
LGFEDGLSNKEIWTLRVPQPLRSHILSFGTLRQLFKIPPFSAPKLHSAGGRGGPQIIFWVGILIFLLFRSPCKISNPTITPSGRISNEPEEREKEREKKCHL